MKKYLPLALILVLGLLLRLPLVSGSLWLDEAAQALESSRPLAQQYLIADDFQPPLLHYVIHFVLFLTHSEAGLRSVSVLAGLVSIAFLYLILREKLGEQPAVVGGVLLAINPFHIFFSQELRPYSLAIMFACVSWWALTTNAKRFRPMLVFIIATAAGLYSMYLYPFILLSQLIYVGLEQRTKLKSTAFGAVIAGLIFLPWLPFFLQQLKVGTDLTKTLPGWSQVVATPVLKAFPMVIAKFIVGPVELKDSPSYYVVAGICGVIVLIASRSVWREKKFRFLVYWLWATILGAWLISFIVPVIQPKRVMGALPAMAGILAAWSAGKQWSRRRLGIYIIGLVFLGSTLLYWNTPKYQRENWRDLIRTMEADSGDLKSVAVFAFPEPFAPWRWYGSQRIDALAAGSLRINSTEQLDPALKGVHDYRRVYVFDHLMDLSDPQRLIWSWLATQGYKEVRSLDGGNVGFVRVFDSL